MPDLVTTTIFRRIVPLAVVGCLFAVTHCAHASGDETAPESVPTPVPDLVAPDVVVPDVLAPVAAGEVFEFAAASGVLTQRCADCHSGDEGEGGFDISKLALAESLSTEFDLWHQVRHRVADGSMPPSDAEPLPMGERTQFVDWIERATLDSICGHSFAVGPPVLRRMTRYEYANTIRDLVGVHFNAAAALPEDMAGGEGFTNAGETLMVSPVHAERFLDAATEAMNYAVSDNIARELLLPDQPGEETSSLEAATANIRRFANRAFRRPVGDDELSKWIAVFEQQLAAGQPFDEAVLHAMRGILISPQFLFLAEAPPTTPGVPELLTDHELASRLSYFLWASMPDDSLRRAADVGRLTDPEVLRDQTLRLIGKDGTHLRDSMAEFIGQWLGTADLGVSRQVDREKHTFMNDPEIAALRNQPIYVFESLLQNNESLLQLIDSDWTFLNNELCRVYQIDRDKLNAVFVQNLVRVDLPEEYQYRGSILAMGGVAAVSSYPRRSSPILRGTWVLERLFGVELPTPPPDVPPLDDSAEVAAAMTLRQRLELHRADPTCASCHDRIDPIGFAMENFNEVGRWRDADDGGPINAVAETSDGHRIEGLHGLKDYLKERRNEVMTQLVRKMLGYALGRSLKPTDLCTVRSIVQRLEEDEYRAQTLILGIVESDLFRMKQ